MTISTTALSCGSDETPLAPRRLALVPRHRLLDRLAEFGDGVVVVKAPAGYGKTVLLRQWLTTESRPVSWIGREVGSQLKSDPVKWLSRAATRSGQPFVMVVDDVHLISETAAKDVAALLEAGLPPGSTLVLSGRSVPPVRLGRLRVEHRLLDLAATDLAMDQDEAEALFRSTGLSLSADEIGALMARTEGWPAALRLAADENARVDDAGEVVASFAGDDRWVSDYVHEELLADLDADTLAFLCRISPLERLTGPLCDAVAVRTGSAELLEHLAGTNRLVLPLDNRSCWYRLHPLLAGFMHARLDWLEPELRPVIHARACEWHLAAGDIDRAVFHAVRSGDLDRAADIMGANACGFVSTGRSASIARWLAWLSEEQMVSDPTLCVVAALERFGAGDGAASAVWLTRAERAEEASKSDSAPVAMLRALLSPSGARPMADDASAACRGLPDGDGHASSCLLVGAAAFMLGDTADAERYLAQGGAEAGQGSPGLLAVALAHRAVLEIERGHWDDATGLARQGREMLAHHGLDDEPSLLLVTAVSCLIEARTGRVVESEADRLRTVRSMAGYTHVASWANLQARIAMSRASLIVGRRVEARRLVEETERLLERVPDALGVKEQVAGVRRSLLPDRLAAGWSLSSLTAAEHRVLQHLPTNLTLADIADRLYVSRNTVKTQAIAIYRKLGASSRGEAVDIAREAGLLDDPTRPL